jgi:hypothetical protein
MSKRKCASCGNPLSRDEGYWAEGYRRDVCQECYHDIVSTCQLCGDPDVMPSDVSDFILVKTELAFGACRPPGIYRIRSRPFLSIPTVGAGHLHAHDVVFIDKLPKSDALYEISGHICNTCAKHYAQCSCLVYGETLPSAFTRDGWTMEREHTRSVIMKNPDMLRDLECEKDGNRRWDEFRECFLLPRDLPTWNEWVLFRYRGVTVYKIDQEDRHGENWVTLRPEPRYRGCWRREPGVLICASGLPTWPKQREEPGRYSSPYDWARQHSIPALKRAIRQGILTQNGMVDGKGNVVECR